MLRVINENKTESLNLASNNLMEWFSNNKTKVNSGKFHLLICSSDEMKICLNDVINSITCEKLLRKNCILNFNIYITIRNKAEPKNSALCKITPFMELPKTEFLNNCTFHALIRHFSFSLDVPKKNQE